MPNSLFESVPSTFQIVSGIIFLLLLSESTIRSIKKRRQPEDGAGVCIFCFFVTLLAVYVFLAIGFGVLQSVFGDPVSLWLLKAIFAPLLVWF